MMREHSLEIVDSVRFLSSLYQPLDFWAKISDKAGQFSGQTPVEVILGCSVPGLSSGPLPWNRTTHRRRRQPSDFFYRDHDVPFLPYSAG